MWNTVSIESVQNYVSVSLFDVTTTTYFLNSAATLEENKEVT
jgi:hypothetical protein